MLSATILSRPVSLTAAAVFAFLLHGAPAEARQGEPAPPSPAAAPLRTEEPPAPEVQPCPEPTRLPPAGSPVLYRCLQFIFHPINQPSIPAETYAYYLRTLPSAPSQDRWVPYNEDSILEDFDALWRTSFLDNLWVEVADEPYPNGVMGRKVVFHMEERSRVKMVDYVSADGESLKVPLTKIEETLRDRDIRVRLDTFVDEATMRRVSGVIRELYAEEGYLYPEITPTRTPLAGGPKLVHLTFTIDSGPKVRLREIVFEGNDAFDDGDLRGQMEANKTGGMLSFIGGGGTYQESKFAEDAQAIVGFYQQRGYLLARVGQPQVEIIRTSADGEERWIRLRIPVDEGSRYRVGTFEIAGTTAVDPAALRRLFKIEEGEYFNRKRLDDGFEKVQEVYGAAGYYHWTPDPDFRPRDVDPDTGDPIPGQPAIVDITLNMNEGDQFFVNRITFLGNDTTHDAVIRRELRLYERGVFSTTALKESIRRLNQLGYFASLEDGEAIKIEEVPGQNGQVNLTLSLEEQNRNQLTFGGGVSQFDGFFGQLSFQTANFLGRGETVGISLQRGSQAENYQVSFSEPYLLERPISIGVDLYSREYTFPSQYSQVSTGGNFVTGFPLSDYTRMFLGYSYAEIAVEDINPNYLIPEVLEASPFLRESLLVDQGGRRTVSKISPSVVFNTVNQPIFPTAGSRLSASFDVAGLGGNTSYVQGRLEGILYVPIARRLSAGFRAQSEYIRPYGQTRTLPIFERLFLGGEYSVRGFDIRSIGPVDETGQLVVGGNKTLLFNAELYFDVFGPVRLVGFYDAGQARDLGENFGWWEDAFQSVQPLPALFDPLQTVSLRDPNVPRPVPERVVYGRRNAFKTSTGFEVRFFMPVLNVPFRLIGAYNPQRGGIFDNSGQPQPRFTTRFAVGTTF
jgi:outer membrane protein insertion porin family